MDEVDRLQREMKGLDPDAAPGPRKRPRPTRGHQAPRPSGKPRQPQASERSSILAQRWYDAAEQMGFALPYDVNYLALALQHKIETDPEFRPYLLQGHADQVERWVAKMVERWWAEYVDTTIHARNAKDMFLGEDWDDLRYYAHSCLRAAYLVEHGTRVSTPMYPDQQDYHERLERTTQEAMTKRVVAETLEAPSEEHQIDPEGRGRLRSFVERRRRK